MSVCAHLVERLEAVLSLDRAKLRDVGWSIRCEFRAYRIRHGHTIDGRRKQVRTFGDGTADCDSTGTSSLDSKSRGRRVILVDQILRAGDEVLPRIGLGQLLCRQMPIFAVLTAASDVGDRIHASQVKPSKQCGIEIWIQSNAISAVALEPGGMRAIERHTLLADNGQRH